MNWRRAGFMLLAVVASLAVLRILRTVNNDEVSSGMADPAIAFYTRTHGSGYGGIDRWSYAGMKAESVVELLKKDDYACMPRQDFTAGANQDSGLRTLACNKDVQWPLPRKLSITASIRYDQGLGGRLVAASASSTIAGDDHSILKYSADFLRKMGWIEPEKLQVNGLEIDSVDRLSQFVINTLLTAGWHRSCDDGFSSELLCAEYANERRKSGFPSLPKAAAAVGDAVAIQHAMAYAGFMPQHPNAKPRDNLIVRVADEKMWVDFVGKDLAGRELMVSVALDSEGGAPQQLIAKVGTASKVVALAGARWQANNGATIFLVPRAGEQNPRVGAWVYMPDETQPSTLKKLAEVLPDTDPAFIPRVIKAIIASASTVDRPEESLGLYAALRSIEHKADMLRLAHAERWLPKDQGNQLVKDAYQDDPATRAAWALAMCESTADPVAIDADCWQRLTHADSNVTALLRSEVAELQVLYAQLEPTHPLRLRLKRLSDALSST